MRRSVKVAVVSAALLAVGGLGFGVANATSSTGTAESIGTAQPAVRPHAGPARALAAATPTVTPESLFVPLNECRVVDTAVAGGHLPSGASRNFTLAGTGLTVQGGPSAGCGIPLSATAVAVRLEATGETGSGQLFAYAYGHPQSYMPDLQYTKGLTAVSAFTLARAQAHPRDITVHNNGATVTVIMTVQGYYAPQIEAQVNGDGTVSSGTSRIVDVVHGGTGFYYVDIDRNARSCSVQATAYNIYRYASTGYSSTTTPNRVSVYVWYMNGTTPTPVDYPFHVLITC